MDDEGAKFPYQNRISVRSADLTGRSERFRRRSSSWIDRGPAPRPTRFWSVRRRAFSGRRLP